MQNLFNIKLLLCKDFIYTQRVTSREKSIYKKTSLEQNILFKQNVNFKQKYLGKINFLGTLFIKVLGIFIKNSNEKPTDFNRVHHL